MKVLNRNGEITDFKPFEIGSEKFNSAIVVKSNTGDLENVDPVVTKAIEQNTTTKIQLKE